ncbi:MAG TPA: helix-turn-helix domain-containing protein [Sphingomonas sp.]|nr:helix-turn-helix domain-containing protein [Sphingomonas sp.]
MSAAKRKSITIELEAEEPANVIPPLERLTVRVPEAAQLLSVSRAALYRLLNAGEIEASKSGQKTLVHVASIRAFIERHRVVAGPATSSKGE